MRDREERGASSYIDGPTEGKDKKWTRGQLSQGNFSSGTKLHNPQHTQFTQCEQTDWSTNNKEGMPEWVASSHKCARALPSVPAPEQRQAVPRSV